MKLRHGSRYITASGHITGRLVLNPMRSINYGYLDPSTNREYNEEGEEWNRNPVDRIIGRYYGLDEDGLYAYPTR